MTMSIVGGPLSRLSGLLAHARESRGLQPEPIETMMMMMIMIIISDFYA